MSAVICAICGDVAEDGWLHCTVCVIRRQCTPCLECSLDRHTLCVTLPSPGRPCGCACRAILFDPSAVDPAAHVIRRETLTADLANWRAWAEWKAANAARCECGAAVFHVAHHILAGFIRDHRLTQRAGCGRVEIGVDLEECDRRFTPTPEQGVLSLW